ncbi:hypothetical protein [Clavibacter michiganensis]|uniref:hypothetical protein n=1 Tax=Clavibacter michiganensis TaxID=28447 RepID=UPI001F3EBE2A|nr:hypothetical protein [Clavibacter michiganensis]
MQRPEDHEPRAPAEEQPSGARAVDARAAWRRRITAKPYANSIVNSGNARLSTSVPTSASATWSSGVPSVGRPSGPVGRPTMK